MIKKLLDISLLFPYPYLYGGKERRRFAGLGDSDFHARFLTTATALWQAPDVHAGNRPWLSPFVFCSANPIRRIDPTGMDDVLRCSKTKTPPGIKLFDDEEEYKRLVGLNVESKEGKSNNSSGKSVEDNKEEGSAGEKVQIGMDALNTSQGAKVNVIEIDAKKKTGIKNGNKAIKAYGGSTLQKYIKLSRSLGFIGAAVSVYNTYNTWEEYTKSGGDDMRVKAKLAGDGTVAIASIFFGIWGFGGGVIYNVADAASDGFGTDEMIEEQKKKENETNNP